eukprot:9147427-Pyramimonas_sp.AAC.1
MVSHSCMCKVGEAAEEVEELEGFEAEREAFLTANAMHEADCTANARTIVQEFGMPAQWTKSAGGGRMPRKLHGAEGASAARQRWRARLESRKMAEEGG